MNGKTDGQFHPEGLYTIEQSIVTFNRMYDALREQLTPLCGYDISLEKEYQNFLPAELHYKKILDGYAIVCYSFGTEERALVFSKISEKGGEKGASIPYHSVGNFEWKQADERLYFTASYDGTQFHLDVPTMTVVS